MPEAEVTVAIGASGAGMFGVGMFGVGISGAGAAGMFGVGAPKSGVGRGMEAFISTGGVGGGGRS